MPVPLSGTPSAPECTLYVCGATPYESGHLGHAFTFLSFDLLVRYLESQGVKVRYIQNVTDVDDPLFERARRDGEDWRQLADRETRGLVRDLAVLGWRAPDHMPRVSEEIESILGAVDRLAAAGHTYLAGDGTLYFRASTYPGFGGLSHRTRTSMLRKLRDEGLLGEVGPGRKEDALDFPLWRTSAPDEPSWPSAHGPGRPGWHIECSAMAMRHLGPQIDIHGGGRDLTFSHHESERAQSESLTGESPFARAWMHVGMVRYEGKKMSKSLGNLVKVQPALAHASPGAIRLYLLSHHYRSDWSFSWPSLAAYERFGQRLEKVLFASSTGSAPGDGALLDRFRAAMDRDLDTPSAMRVLREAVRLGRGEAAAAMYAVLGGGASLHRVFGEG